MHQRATCSSYPAAPAQQQAMHQFTELPRQGSPSTAPGWFFRHAASSRLCTKQPQHSTRPCPTMLPELPCRQPKHSTGYAPPCRLGAARKGSPTHSNQAGAPTILCLSRLPQQPKHSTSTCPCMLPSSVSHSTAPGYAQPCCPRAARKPAQALHRARPHHKLSGAAPPGSTSTAPGYVPALCFELPSEQLKHSTRL
jgi:hypothetical protein